METVWSAEIRWLRGDEKCIKLSKQQIIDSKQACISMKYATVLHLLSRDLCRTLKKHSEAKAVQAA
jgi:hypothetical protein